MVKLTKAQIRLAHQILLSEPEEKKDKEESGHKKLLEDGEIKLESELEE